MEPIGLQAVLAILKEFGIPGLVLLMWYLSMKGQNRMLDSYRDDTGKILIAYREDVQAMQQMYKDNVVLVKSYQNLSADLKDIVTINSRTLQSLDDSIKRALKDYR